MAPKNNKSATWWSVTAYNEEISIMEDSKQWPHWVRRVYGGREECPSTGTEHFQGAIQCWQSVRMSQFKEFLPTAHLEQAKQKEALMKYAMKAATAIGEKKVQENNLPFFSADAICTKIAQAILSDKNPTDNPTDKFWLGVRSILREEPRLAGQLMNPSLRGFYNNTEGVWLDLARTIVLQSLPQQDFEEGLRFTKIED